MTCVAIGPVTLPQIPAFLLTAPQLTSPFPVGIEGPCCRFELTIPGIDAALAAVNAAIAAQTAASGAPVMLGVMALNAAMDQIQAKLNELVLRIPRCPIDGATLPV